MTDILFRKQEFWEWAYSDFRSNAQRGVLAEYIVARALSCVGRKRMQWDAYDLITNCGIKVEVKSSAYLQVWKQNRPSEIRFDIAPKYAWCEKENAFRTELIRPANIYIFCVFFTKTPEQANELDINQWFFLVCSSRFLNEELPVQKSISLSSLEKLGIGRIKYHQLADAVMKCASKS
ncbi:hypothetical protein H0A71_20080 [Alcaligenaceae bacterium]|nr:hypothetical protein [Alcaligenaceae bacterium]